MGNTMDFDAAMAGQQPENPASSDNIFADLAPPEEAFAGMNIKYGRQHVVLMLDNSGSMASAGKIDECNLAKNGLVAETAVPANKDSFLITEIPFNEHARRSVFAESAVGLKLIPGTAGGGTNFEEALQLGLKSVRELDRRPNPEGYKYYRPVMILMSDGYSDASDAIIQQAQEEADIICIAFGMDADTKILEKIASDGQAHRVSTDGGELQKFLAKVGQTLSETFQSARV